jgi:MFS family permease
MGDISQARRRALPILIVALAVCGVAYARSILGPLQEIVQHAMVLSDHEVALLQGLVIALPIIVAGVPIGLAVDRFSRVRLLLVAVALAAAGSIGTALATDFLWLALARGCIGLGKALALVAAYSLVADFSRPEQRGRATMVVALGEVCGAPLAFSAGGLLLGLWASDIAAFAGAGFAVWRADALIMTIPLIALLVPLALLREPPRLESEAKAGKVGWRQVADYRHILLPLLLARSMVWLADGAVVVWGTPTLIRDFAMTPAAAAVSIGSVLLVAGVLGPILGGFIADLCQRYGGPRTTLKALTLLTLASVPAGLFGVAPDGFTATLLLGLFLLLGYTLGTTALAYGTVVLPNALRGAYLSASLIIASLFSLALAPLVVSGTTAWLGGAAHLGQALAIVCGAAAALGAAVFAASAFGWRRGAGMPDSARQVIGTHG